MTMDSDELLTVKQVAAELGISPDGVYKLISRGRLEYEARSAHNKRVRRSVLEAYRQSFAVPTRVRKMPEVLAEFSIASTLTPEEFERRWLARELEDTDENARLWAMARMLTRWLAQERSKRTEASAVAVMGFSDARG